jgi:anthranilate synthase/aminodeoxychorismate synthase-like glutamine amidotransferase
VIFLLDNYDSFTYNLAQYIGELGHEVEVRRNDQTTLEEIDSLAPEAIIISPGPCTPSEAGLSVPVVNHFAGKIPILGVCLGHQSIGQAFGGKIVRAPVLMHGKTSEIHHDGRTIFARMAQPFRATRYHSLVIEPKSVPDCLEVSARTADGVIMAVRHREVAIEGVQFHPESILTNVGHDLLRNFFECYAGVKSATV